MPRNDVERLKQLFKSKFQHVSDYWLECCIDWFKEQHTDYTQQYMDDIIIQQWLETDLREIEVSCLPPNLSREKKLILRGNYAMQIMYFRDISKPALSQLRDIRNMYNLTRNHVDNENENSLSANRVLYFQMTDGVQLINGFEYQSIPVLNINLKPGIKVLLLGPVLVQNGEFILKPNNVKILGGEVEDLLVTNAVENVLARELNLPINPNPGQAIVTAHNNTAQNRTTVANVVQNTAIQQSTIPNRQNGAAAAASNRTNTTTTSRNQTNQKQNAQTKANVIVIESDEEDMLMAHLDASETAYNNVQSRHQDLDDEEEMLLAHLDACESTSYAQSTRQQNSRSNVNAYQQNIDDEEEQMLLAQLDACESKYTPGVTDDLNIDSNMFNDTKFSDQENKIKSHNSSSSVKNYDSINDTALLNVDIPEIDDDDDNKPRPTLSQEYFNFDIEDDLALMAELDTDIAEQMTVKIPLIETVEPFVYIKQLLDNRERITSAKYTVKARFTRVIERINVSKEKGWSMQFEISDGTGNVVVDFLSEVLEGVMALSPAEALEEKMNVKRKKLVSFEKLTKALILCKQKLQAFDGLIDLQFKEGIDIATITRMEQMKRRHLDQLNERIESAKVKFQ